MSNIELHLIDSIDVPNSHAKGEVYRLLPNEHREDYYRERTDRNIGWITQSEQESLRNYTVGIAGCGGMGGLIAATMVRIGIGEVRIADREDFDVSNINRQYAAGRNSVGKHKALETARLIRHTVSDDTTLVVYPQGITTETAGHFAQGCDLIFDEIEFYAVGARVFLHIIARELGIVLLNCNTVGHRTFCFKFTKDSMTVETALGLSYERAAELEELVRKNPQSQEGLRAAAEIQARILRVFVPDTPEYSANLLHYSTSQVFDERLEKERRVSIIGTNPVMASGFAANRGLYELLSIKPSFRRNIQEVPPMPGYLSFDALQMQAAIVSQQWWRED